MWLSSCVCRIFISPRRSSYLLFLRLADGCIVALFLQESPGNLKEHFDEFVKQVKKAKNAQEEQEESQLLNS